MAKARRYVRWGLYVVGGLLALVVVARVGLGIYLSTSTGKEFVSRKMSAQIGMPVQVTNVRLGLMTSTIGMRVFDPAAPNPDTSEVLDVANAKADVSVFEIATGNINVKRVDLNGVALTLHVSANGIVITSLPQMKASGKESGGPTQIPTIHLTGGQLVVRQDGRPEFALRNLSAVVKPEGDVVKLTGAIDDPEWSKWALEGEISRTAKTGQIVLKTDDGPLTMDRLGSIPFVPPVVWKHVRPNGRGAAALKLWTDADVDVHYSVDLKPAAADLKLLDASATLEKVTGLINVTGAKVTLTGTKAELAGGTLAVDGDLDFGPEPMLVNLKVAAEKLDLKKLPPEWGLQKKFDGKLRGKAELSLKVYDDGRIVPRGGGEGAITDVMIHLPKGDIKSDDIPIHLKQVGNKYEFKEVDNAGGGQEEETAAGGTRVDTARAELLRLLVTTCVAQDKKPADPPKKDEPKKDDAKEPQRGVADPLLDATIRFRDIDIAELLTKLDVKLGYKVSGRVTAEAKIAVAVSQAASGSAYKFTGKVTSPALTLEGLTVRELSANMLYQDGKFTLSELVGKIDQPGQGQAAPGVFRGTLTGAISPPGEVRAALAIDRIPLGEVLKALPGFVIDVKGTVSGDVTMTAPYDKLSDPATWGGSGEVTSSELVVEGRSAKDIKLSAVVAKGQVSLKEAKVSLEGIPVTADATLGLSGKYPFTATVKTTGTNVTDLRKLVPEFELPAPVEGVLETETKVVGTASPLTYTATGSVKATKLTLAKSSANHIALKWELTPEKVVVSDLKAETFGGSVTGSAVVPLVADTSGVFEVAFKELDAAAATELVPDFPVKITGKVSGKVAGTIPPAKEGQSRVGNIDLDITAPKLTVQGIPAERLAGKAALKGGAVEYALEGKTLGGSFDIKGRYPGAAKKDKPPAGKDDRGSFHLTGVDLSRLAGGVGFKALEPLRGRLDADFEFENDLSAGSGRIVMTRVVWGGQVISQELVGVLVLRDGVLQLSEVTGRVAGGSLRARGLVRLDDTQRNFFTVALTGADAKRLLAPFGAGVNDLLDGPVSVVVHARVGGETRGSGTLTLPRGSASGIQVTDLRVPFSFATAPGGYGRLSVREAAVQAGSGRVRADLTLDWGYETRIDGQVKFIDVPLRAVVPELGENALFGNGRITGRFDINGAHVRTSDDVSGTLIAKLSNTSVKEIPILKQVTPFLNATGLTKPFQTGDIRGTLKQGVFRVERLALANPAAQLFAEGSINLNGRLDLDVVAHTGTIGPDARGLRLFGLRIPSIGPVPIGLIRDVTDFLSNRTVRLTITGTTGNPVVRVNVGALLTEQAVRFFVSRYLPPGVGAALYETDILGGGGGNR